MAMSVKRIVSMLGTICITCSVMSQGSNEFIIEGKVSGVPDGVNFYLIRTGQGGTADTISVSKSLKGRFRFQGRLDQEGELHFAKMDTTVIKIQKGKHSWVRLLLENRRIKIEGDAKAWPDVAVLGSTYTTDFKELDSMFNKYSQNHQQIIIESQGNSASIQKQVKDYRQQLLSLIARFNNSGGAPIIALNSGISEIAFYEAVYSLLSAKVIKSYYGGKLTEYISSLKMRDEIQLGKTIPNFSILSVDGKEMFIHDLAKTAKITLIDFWASWCAPCRKAIPDLLKTYQNFHNQDFNIIGISIDVNLAAWKNAMIVDNTPWIHGIDKKNANRNVFGLSSIPAYILIDNQGRLLAFDRGMSTIPAFGPNLTSGSLVETLNTIFSETSLK